MLEGMCGGDVWVCGVALIMFFGGLASAEKAGFMIIVLDDVLSELLIFSRNSNVSDVLSLIFKVCV